MAGKADLINGIVDSVEGLTRRQATEAFEAVFAAIIEAVKAGESAKVPGFGSFSLSERASRKGRNPATRESITIKASKSVRFKPGKELKEAANTRHRKTRPAKSRPPAHPDAPPGAPPPPPPPPPPGPPAPPAPSPSSPPVSP